MKALVMSHTKANVFVERKFREIPEIHEQAAGFLLTVLPFSLHPDTAKDWIDDFTYLALT